MKKKTVQTQAVLTPLLDVNLKLIYSEAVAQKCSVKRCSKKFRRNSQGNTCARASFLITLQAGLQRLQNFWKFCEIS